MVFNVNLELVCSQILNVYQIQFRIVFHVILGDHLAINVKKISICILMVKLVLMDAQIQNALKLTFYAKLT